MIEFIIEFISILIFFIGTIILGALIQLIVYQVFGFSIFNYIYKLAIKAKIN